MRDDADLYDYSDGRLQSEQRHHDGGLHLDGGHGRAGDYGRANRQQLGLQSRDDAFGCGCEGASDGWRRLRRTDDQRVACGWRNTLRGDADLHNYGDGRLQFEQRHHDGGLHLDSGHGRADDYERANRQQLGLQSRDDAFGCGCEGASDG